MFGYTFFCSAIFAMLAIGSSHVISAIEHAYAARYNREIYLTAKVKRKLAEDGQELLEKAKNPEWEPVEDEPDESDAAQSYWRRKKDKPENATFALQTNRKEGAYGA